MLYVLQEDVLTYAVNGKFQSKLYTFPSTLPACDRADCAKVQEQQDMKHVTRVVYRIAYCKPLVA